MTDANENLPPLVRQDRGNRDAFSLALIISALFALLLVVLGICAYRSRFVVLGMPSVPIPEKSISRPSAANGMAPPAGAEWPEGFLLTLACDAGAGQRALSSRPAALLSYGGRKAAAGFGKSRGSSPRAPAGVLVREATRPLAIKPPRDAAHV